MCYYVSGKLSKQEIFEIETDLGHTWEEEPFEPFYAASGFSHPKLPVITSEGRFRLLRWGLIPSWVKDWKSATEIRIKCLNAISEEVEGKPSFRSAVKAGRFCVLPVTGFFEWHADEKDNKYPHYIHPKDSPFFFMAGLHEQWVNKEIDEVHDTFTILTTRANSRMEWIHNKKMRMPVILGKNDVKLWLDPSISFSSKKQLLEPFGVERMADHSISKLITSRKENPNTPAVLEPFNYPELAIA